jgi:hypothetical protein
MQRTKLYVSGVKVPPLGSAQDRVLRDYMTKEAELEAEREKLSMLNTLSTPSFTDQAKANAWEKEIQRTWSSYLHKLFNVELSEESQKDIDMMEFYTKVVKHMRPKVKKSKSGKLVVEGLRGLDVSDFRDDKIPTQAS